MGNSRKPPPRLGRPPLPEGKRLKVTPVRLAEDMIEELDELARISGDPSFGGPDRSAVIRGLLREALDARAKRAKR